MAKVDYPLVWRQTIRQVLTSALDRTRGELTVIRYKDRGHWMVLANEVRGRVTSSRALNRWGVAGGALVRTSRE
jgi:hypothetical protein